MRERKNTYLCGHTATALSATLVLVWRFASRLYHTAVIDEFAFDGQPQFVRQRQN